MVKTAVKTRRWDEPVPRIEIKRRRREIEKEIKAAEVELRKAERKMRDLQKECSHPNIREFFVIGHRCVACDDCGYQD